MAGIYDLLITSNFLSNGGIQPTGTINIDANGTYDVTQYASAEVAVPMPTEEEKTVRFLDYDGTVVQEYTKKEFLALDAMPSNPTHQGLVSDGWNWSLNEAKTHVNKYDYLDIGQIYDTDDGKTRMYITFEDSVSLDLTITYSQTLSDGVIIDWGDGSATESKSGTGAYSLTHTYAHGGDYVIKIDVLPNCTPTFGSQFWKLNNSVSKASNLIRKIHYGSHFDTSTFYLQNHTAMQVCTFTKKQTSFPSLSGCYNLQAIIVPYGVTRFDSNTFQNCYGLLRVSIPNGVTTLAGTLFYYASNLERGILPDTINNYSSNPFGYSYPSVVVAPAVYLNITSDIFLKQGFLFDAGKTNISVGGFSGAYNLREIHWPSNVVSTATSAFQNCYSLKSVELPNTITSIGSTSFSGCVNLSDIQIPSGVTTIGNSVFQSCQSFESIELPDTVTSIGTGTFSSCLKLSHIKLPSTLTTISASMFTSCYSLKEIELPSTITTIDTNAFNQCYNLQEITIPKNVSTIGGGAFTRCKNLIKIDFSSATSVPTLGGTNVFSETNSTFKIIVPDSLYSTWIGETNWSAYASKIVKVSEV